MKSRTSRGCVNVHSLCYLPNEANAVLVGLAETKNASRAHADARVTYCGYGIQSVVVGARGDDLRDSSIHTLRQLTAEGRVPRGNIRVRCRGYDCMQ